MKGSSLAWITKISLITFFGFFFSVSVVIILWPTTLLFWIISRVVHFMIWLKLGNGFSLPTGMDIIQGFESNKSRPFISVATRFAGRVNIEKFCDRFDESIFRLKTAQGKLRYRKCSQVFEEIYGFHVFRDDPDFNIRNQIRRIRVEDLLPDKNELDEYGGSRPLEWEKVVELTMQKYGSDPTPPGRPQWEIILVEEEENSTMVFRMHHSYCDGVYFVRFLMEHVGDVPVECRLPYNYHQPNAIRRFFENFWAFCLLPYGIYRLCFKYEKSPLHGPKLSGRKMFLLSKRIPMKILKEIKTSTKTSINTILFTCVSNAIARNLQKRRAKTENIIALIPVSLQDLDKPIKLKNKFIMIGILLPTFIDPDDPSFLKRKPSSAVERLHRVHDYLYFSETDPSFLAIHAFLVFLCSILPSRIINATFSCTGYTTSLSNIVGPQKGEFYFSGAQAKDFAFWIPDRSPLGMGISITGFDGSIRVGLMVDRALIATENEGQEFLDDFVKEIFNLSEEVNANRESPTSKKEPYNRLLKSEAPVNLEEFRDNP